MQTVVGVRFKKACKIYYFGLGGLELAQGDGVVVKTARGVEFGTVVIGPRDVPDSEVVQPLKDVQRKATQEDIDKLAENSEKEKEAYAICEEKIRLRELPMKLISVEYTLDVNKIIFYFTAEGRIDFRELVKDLATIFKTRIELRQIGVRDEAKMIGGLGPCGRPLCCSTFLGDFASVSIKMAKEQSLSLNPTKISGICGRLMCCLNYEQSTYEEIRKELPRVGSVVETELGKGEVVGNNVLKELVRVKLPRKNEEIIQDFKMYDVKLISGSYEGEVEDTNIRLEITDEADKALIKNLIKDN